MTNRLRILATTLALNLSLASVTHAGVNKQSCRKDPTLEDAVSVTLSVPALIMGLESVKKAAQNASDLKHKVNPPSARLTREARALTANT